MNCSQTYSSYPILVIFIFLIQFNNKMLSFLRTFQDVSQSEMFFF